MKPSAGIPEGRAGSKGTASGRQPRYLETDIYVGTHSAEVGQCLEGPECKMRLPIGIIVLCVVGTHSAEVGQCLEGPECVVGMRNTTRIHCGLLETCTQCLQEPGCGWYDSCTVSICIYHKHIHGIKRDCNRSSLYIEIGARLQFKQGSLRARTILSTIFTGARISRSA